MAVRLKKFCAYCGGTRYHAPGTPRPKDYCQCSYKHMRMGASGFSTETTSGRPASEMKEYLLTFLDAMDSKANVIFKFSVTKLDEEKIKKAATKRQVAKVAARLTGGKE